MRVLGWTTSELLSFSDYQLFLRLFDSWSYISTPSMVLTSSTDTVAVNGVCGVCGAEQCDQNFGQKWREKSGEIATEMIAVSCQQTFQLQQRLKE